MLESFKKAINALTVRERGEPRFAIASSGERLARSWSKSKVTSFRKRAFSTGRSETADLNSEFASFLEDCDDVQSYSKNYLAVGFKLDYVKGGRRHSQTTIRIS